MKDKDYSIELLRIIACYFVICIHISLGYYFDNCLSKSALLLACFQADAVAMFWLITGCFYFRKIKYSDMIRGTIKKIVLPMLCLILFIQLFEGWLFGGMTVIQSMKLLSIQRFKEIVKCIVLLWATPVAHSGQLWYVFVYILVIVMYPVEDAFVAFLNTSARRNCFFAISFGILVLNDISQNQFCNFSHHTFGATIPAIIIIIWGHFVYLYRKELAERINGFVWIILFIVINILRCLIQGKILLGAGEPQYAILFWYSSFGLLATICMYMSVYCFAMKIKHGKLLIYLIGGMTFNIYLIHELVIDLCDKYFIKDYILKTLGGVNGTLSNQILYYLIYGGILFLLCFLIALIPKCVYKPISILVYRIKRMTP